MLPGLVAGRFRILRQLGRGGMGEVFLASDEDRGAPVALKVLLAQEYTESALRHFEQEFRTLAALSHPNLTEVHDFGRVEVVENDRVVPFFTMEYVDGATIDQWFDTTRAEIDLLGACLVQVGHALAYLHARGWVHRDIKPSNIMVTPGSDGRPVVKLMDFGLVGRPRDAAGPTGIRGTVHYLAPEAARGDNVDPRSDLYSLGCVIYELLAGRPPFQGATALDVLRGHLIEAPIPPSTFDRSIPADLEGVILRLLAKDPGQRPAGADRFLEMLNQAFGGRLAVGSPEQLRTRVLGGGFAGRDADVKRLLDLFADARSDGAPVVLLVGQAGIGKSRLLREFQIRCQIDGFDVFAGNGSLVDALRRAVRARAGAGRVSENEHAAALDRLAGDTEPPADQAEPFDPGAAVGAVVDDLAKNAPFALIVDDLHVADETTFQLVRELARRGPTRGVLVLGAYRGEEVSRSHPFFEVVSEGRERGSIEEIFVEPLGASDSASVLRAMLGAEEIPGAFVERLVEETRGNPLHMSELVAHLAEQGLVRPGSGEPPDPRVLEGVRLPGRMRDLVALRLERVGDEPRRVLEAASILDRSVIDPDATSAVGDLRWETTTRHLRELVATGLLLRDEDEAGAPVFLFAHRDVADLVVESLASSQARVLHARALSYLERRGLPRRPAAWAALGRHAEAAGKTGRAIEAFSRAADLAREMNAQREAIRLYGRAIDLAPRDEDSAVPLLCSLLGSRCEIHVFVGDLNRAEEDARALIEVAERGRSEVLSCRSHLALGDVLLAGARIDEARGHLARARELALGASDPDLASRAARALGRADSTEGRIDDACGRFDEAIAAARGAGLVEREVEALVDKGVALRESGRLRESTACFEDATGRAGRRPPASVEVAVLEGAAVALEMQGRYREALSAFERARDRARERGDASAFAALSLSLGGARLRAGDPDGASSAFDDGLDASRRLGSTEGVVRSLRQAAELALHQGRFDSALAAAEDALRRSRRAARPELIATSLNLTGRIYLRAGDLSRAGGCLDEAQRILREARNPRSLASILNDLAEHARLSEATADSRKHAQEAAFLARKAGDRRIESLAMTRLGEAHLSDNDYDKALVACRKAADLVGDSGLPREHADAVLLRARIALARPGGDVVRAEMDALEALAIFDALQEPEAASQAELLAGRAAFRLGRREDAIDRVGRARDRLDALRRRVPARWRAAFGADPRRRDVDDDWERLRAALPRDAKPVEQSATTPSGEFAQLQRDNLALRRLLDINKSLAAARDAETLLPVILDAAVELTGAERGFVLMRDGAELATRSARGAEGVTLEGDDLIVSRSVASRTIEGGTPLLSTDAETDERLAEARSVHGLHIRSVLAVPLRARDQIAGAIYLDSRLDRGLFTPAHQDLAMRLADQAAIALDTAALLARIEEQRETLDRLNRDLERTAAAQRAELADAREMLVSTRSNLDIRFRFGEMVGGSPSMQRVYHLVERLAPKRLPVLVVGESGTGKELIARALHSKSDRSGGPFFSVNCAALPENLLESELFGYRKGAFTGADRNKPGYFELAHGGTLLLDEIGEMGAAMQAKLLRVLQEGEVMPVGGNASIKVDVRIVSATNRDLKALMREGSFREDLYYRIHAARIDVPPLRERREDVPLLVDHFLTVVAESEGEPKKEIDGLAMRLLAAAEWPGNVRELQHQIMRLVAFAKGPTITLRDIERYGDLAPGSAGRPVEPSAPSPDTEDLATLEESEKRQILLALEKADGNKTRAAAILGINRATLFRKLKRLGR